MIAFTIPGRPVPKGRPRMGVRTKGRRMTPVVYTPSATKRYEEKVRIMALAAGVRPADGPVALEADLWLYGRRGDGDNYWKSLADALNGVAYQDDRQIIDWRLRIHRARRREDERAEIVIRRLEEETA